MPAMSRCAQRNELAKRSKKQAAVMEPATRPAGALTISANTLEEALVQVGAIAGWQVAEISALDNGRNYEGSVRMRLDLSQLPKPFQINALNSREWNISSDWHVFEISPRMRPVGKQ